MAAKSEYQYRASFGYPGGRVCVMYFWAESCELARDHAWTVANNESAIVLSVKRVPRMGWIDNQLTGKIEEAVIVGV